MNVRQLIDIGSAPPLLRFLVIGGHAVAAHGHTRATFDVDFFVRKADRAAWKEKILKAGLNQWAEAEVFAQFSQPEGDGLDLMFVNDETFETFWAESSERIIQEVAVRVPSLDNLLALKLHALKQKLPHRTSKDAEDVEMLIRRNELDISKSHYQELFLKYGSREIYETIQRILRY